MTTPVADKYYDKVVGSETPLLGLIDLYCELFSLNKSLPIKRMFERYLEIYGVRRVYYAVLLLGTRFSDVPKDTRRVQNYLDKLLVGTLETEHFGNSQYDSADLSTLVDENTLRLENKNMTLTFREIGEDNE